MSNPVFNENTFNQEFITTNSAMTVNGTILKTMFLLLLVILSSAYTWAQLIAGQTGLVNTLMIIGAIGGFISVLIMSFKMKISSFLAPLYAIFEGFFVGGISAMCEAQMPGIVSQAVLGTFAVLFSLLALYMSKIIVVTEKLRSVIFASTLAICLVYFIAFILSFFHVNMPFLYDASPVSIGISIVVIIVAASNFLLDFDIIEKGANNFAPKYMEWYASVGVLVTLVWLYIEILKLLSKLNRR